MRWERGVWEPPKHHEQTVERWNGGTVEQQLEKNTLFFGSPKTTDRRTDSPPSIRFAGGSGSTPEAIKRNVTCPTCIHAGTGRPGPDGPRAHTTGRSCRQFPRQPSSKSLKHCCRNKLQHHLAVFGTRGQRLHRRGNGHSHARTNDRTCPARAGVSCRVESSVYRVDQLSTCRVESSMYRVESSMYRVEPSQIRVDQSRPELTTELAAISTIGSTRYFLLGTSPTTFVPLRSALRRTLWYIRVAFVIPL